MDATDSRYGFSSKDLRHLGGSELSRIAESIATDHGTSDLVFAYLCLVVVLHSCRLQLAPRSLCLVRQYLGRDTGRSLRLVVKYSKSTFLLVIAAECQINERVHTFSMAPNFVGDGWRLAFELGSETFGLLALLTHAACVCLLFLAHHN